MHKVQMHAGTISKLSYVFASLQAIVHSLNIVDYIPVQTHKPYINLPLFLKFILHCAIYGNNFLCIDIINIITIVRSNTFTLVCERAIS